jgi:hypothetical protein
MSQEKFKLCLFLWMFPVLLYGGVDTVSTKTTTTDSLQSHQVGAAGDSVNIGMLVAAQIEAAKNKQIQDSIAQARIKEIPIIPVQTPAAAPPKIENFITGFCSEYYNKLVGSFQRRDEPTMKLSIFGLVSLATLFIVFFRRRVIKRKGVSKRILKNGIKLIREEKVKYKANVELSMVRNKLLGNPTSFQLTNDSVTKNARDLNIAKGEIYLAARIKSHELKNGSYN